MMRESYANRQQNPPVLENMEIVVALVLMAVCWFSWYVARERYNLTNRQIAEVACYLALGGLAIAGSAISDCHRALPAGEAVAPSTDGCLPQTGRAVYVRSLETRRRGSRLRHPRQALVLAGQSPRHAGHRAGHDRVRQDHASKEHHYAGHGARGRHSERSTPVADGDL